MRDHYRDTFHLFRKWEDAGLPTVQPKAFAAGVREITGVHLTRSDLEQLVLSVQGTDDVTDGIDCKRLWRRMMSAVAHDHHLYISTSGLRQQSSDGILGSGGRRSSGHSRTSLNLGSPTNSVTSQTAPRWR